MKKSLWISSIPSSPFSIRSRKSATCCTSGLRQSDQQAAGRGYFPGQIGAFAASQPEHGVDDLTVGGQHEVPVLHIVGADA